MTLQVGGDEWLALRTSRSLLQSDAEPTTDQARRSKQQVLECVVVQLTADPSVYAYCVRVLGDAAIAADVCQQVREQALRDFHSLEDPEHARGWLFSIATHRCLDAVRARRRAERRFVATDEALHRIADRSPGPDARLETAVVARELDDCIRKLSAESRIAVLLRFQEGMTFQEMSRMCREKPATLQARVMRALPLLRRCVTRKGIAP